MISSFSSEFVDGLLSKFSWIVYTIKVLLKHFDQNFYLQENFDSVNGAYDTQFDLKFFDGEIEIVIQRPEQGRGSAANQVYTFEDDLFNGQNIRPRRFVRSAVSTR